jgi:hypothetical protein
MDSNTTKFWEQWLREAKRLEIQYGEEPFYYAWLAGTMTEEEVNAVKQAATKLGMTVKVRKNGSGEVVRN